jgi:hypothetical protein
VDVDTFRHNTKATQMLNIEIEYIYEYLMIEQCNANVGYEKKTHTVGIKGKCKQYENPLC